MKFLLVGKYILRCKALAAFWMLAPALEAMQRETGA